ncbi:MAG: phosphoribosylglycinamide formyltransferase [Bacteroidota bacterium]
MKNIAIFASGTGSNATKIVEHFANHPTIYVRLVVSNRKSAKVLEMAKANNIPTLLLRKKDFYETEDLLKDLKSYDIHFIALAGFLLLIPTYLVAAFPQKIVNIHPALLPKHGGKGMYGQHVHQAVKQAKEKESGITLHYVNEAYDEGAVIFQAACPVFEEDDVTAIAKRVLALEHYYFPRVLEALLV